MNNEREDKNVEVAEGKGELFAFARATFESMVPHVSVVGITGEEWIGFLQENLGLFSPQILN